MMTGAAAVLFGEALLDDFGTAQAPGGAPFNVACHLAALHAPALLITRLGEDAGAATVRAALARCRLSGAGVQTDPLLPTGRVLVRATAHGHQFSILPQQAYDAIDAGAACAALATVRPALLYFGTLAQRAPASRAALAALLDATPGVPRVLDLNLRPGQVDEPTVRAALQQADVLKVNEEELRSLFGWYLQGAPAGAGQGCRALVEMFGLEQLLLTLGERGAVCFAHDGTVLTGDGAAPPRLADTVGAGDAFMAVWLLGRLHGWPLALALKRATAFASAVCAVQGAVPTDPGWYAGWRLRWGLVEAPPTRPSGAAGSSAAPP